MRHLVDADVANNYGHWQWVAGTGTDTKPYRQFSPARQAERFDPESRLSRPLSKLSGAYADRPISPFARG